MWFDWVSKDLYSANATLLFQFIVRIFPLCKHNSNELQMKNVHEYLSSSHSVLDLCHAVQSSGKVFKKKEILKIACNFSGHW